ncbi:TRAP transporter large permease [Falsiroseomonas sp.]|uniref:TRAP transporter large permease n=1 Tax=Falsiroseomonas sp. TaxID=2870721 RepID=UPI003F720EF0
MIEIEIGLALIAIMAALVLSGIPIGIALVLLSYIGIGLIRENWDLAGRMLALASYAAISDYLFATIPLFVLMGLLVSVSDIGKDTFEVAQYLLRKLRGGLGMATVAANAVFGAVTGISIASAAVFTKVAVPQMMRFGYTPKFAVGCVAGSSILGMLIPPSLLMIIYGVLAEVSIGRLFLAGIVPGLLMALAFVAMIWLLATYRPDMVQPLAAQAALPIQVETTASLLGKSVPIATLITLVLGGLYTGFFTPTEAGAIGAFGALMIALVRRRLSLPRFWRILVETGFVSVGILFLLIAASMYSRMLTMAGIPASIADLIQTMGLGVYGFLLVYILFVLLLGMIIDSSSILLIVTPIAAPIAKDFGIDLIHFGIITVIAVEVGLLTPPFGISAFAVKATLNDKRIGLETIFAGALPFVGVMLAVLALIVAFPGLSLVFAG